MRSCTINLKILFATDIQCSKGMSNSEFYFLVTSQPASTIILMVLQLTSPKHMMIQKDSELDMPFGYCMSVANNIFRFIVHDLIMTEMFYSHYKVVFSATQNLTNFKF